MSLTIVSCSYVIKWLKQSFVKEIRSAWRLAWRFFRVHLSKSNYWQNDVQYTAGTFRIVDLLARFARNICWWRLMNRIDLLLKSFCVCCPDLILTNAHERIVRLNGFLLQSFALAISWHSYKRQLLLALRQKDEVGPLISGLDAFVASSNWWPEVHKTPDWWLIATESCGFAGHLYIQIKVVFQAV